MAKQSSKKEPLLRKEDFSSYLEEKSREIAPRDVEVLLSQQEKARSLAYGLSDRIGNQMSLALELLQDHQDGECPQIPFYTISLLAEAVYYFLDPNDVIPDWIPDIGRLDDALVIELAFEHAVDGVRRYCAWKGIDDSAIYPSAVEPSSRPKAAKKKASKQKAGKGSDRKTGPAKKKRPAKAAKSKTGNATSKASRGRSAKSKRS